MTTAIDRLSTAAATVAREGTTPRAVNLPVPGSTAVERIEVETVRHDGFAGILRPGEDWKQVMARDIGRFRDAYERRIATLEAQVREKDATLAVLARMLRGEGGALPYTRAAALALVESALRVTEDEARAELNSMAAHYQTVDYEDYHGAQE